MFKVHLAAPGIVAKRSCSWRGHSAWHYRHIYSTILTYFRITVIWLPVLHKCRKCAYLKKHIFLQVCCLWCTLCSQFTKDAILYRPLGAVWAIIHIFMVCSGTSWWEMSNIFEVNLETFQNKQVCSDTCTAEDRCSVKRWEDVINMDFTRRRMMTGNSFPIKPAFTGQSWQELRHLNQSGWMDDTGPINHLFISHHCTNHLVFFFHEEWKIITRWLSNSKERLAWMC